MNYEETKYEDNEKVAGSLCLVVQFVHCTKVPAVGESGVSKGWNSAHVLPSLMPFPGGRRPFCNSSSGKDTVVYFIHPEGASFFIICRASSASIYPLRIWENPIMELKK